ncbi:MAG TPA: hypothetical protein VEP50_12110 [bacterium]|nr:hypothetical protein [bacterium]
MIRRSHTTILERNVRWTGSFASEPYEAAWAFEAVCFVRALEPMLSPGAAARVHLSANGMLWTDEGTPASQSLPFWAGPKRIDAVSIVYGRLAPEGLR